MTVQDDLVRLDGRVLPEGLAWWAVWYGMARGGRYGMARRGGIFQNLYSRCILKSDPGTKAHASDPAYRSLTPIVFMIGSQACRNTSYTDDYAPASTPPNVPPLPLVTMPLSYHRTDQYTTPHHTLEQEHPTQNGAKRS